jgi:amino acid transporter
MKATAALCVVSGSYTLRALPANVRILANGEWLEKGIAISYLFLLWLLIAFSSTIAIRTSSAISGMKVALCIFLVVSGIACMGGGFSNVHSPLNLSQAFTFHGTSTNPSNYATAFFQVSFCYTGWSNLSAVLGELKAPHRSAPKAVFAGITVGALAYILANISYISVVGPKEAIKGGVTLGARFTNLLYGNIFGGQIMSLLISLSAFGTALAFSFTTSRVIVEAAKREFLPFYALFDQRNITCGAPFNAITLHCLISLVFIVGTPS